MNHDNEGDEYYEFEQEDTGSSSSSTSGEDEEVLQLQEEITEAQE